MKKFLSLLLVSLIFVGCSSLIPKPVEFFQKEIKPVPTETAEHKEVIKEAAEFVARKSREAHIEAVKENVNTNLLSLTYDTAVVANSLSSSIGPPLKHWNYDAERLTLKLENLEAKLDKKFDEFAKRNDQMAGSKIEDSGLIKIGYVSYILIIIIFIGLLWFGLKIAGIFYPPVAVGTRLASIPVNLASKGLSEVISGVESFKDKVKNTIDDEDLQKKILEMVRTELERKQSPEMQDIIRQITKK